ARHLVRAVLRHPDAVPVAGARDREGVGDGRSGGDRGHEEGDQQEGQRSGRSAGAPSARGRPGRVSGRLSGGHEITFPVAPSPHSLCARRGGGASGRPSSSSAVVTPTEVARPAAGTRPRAFRPEAPYCREMRSVRNVTSSGLVLVLTAAGVVTPVVSLPAPE